MARVFISVLWQERIFILSTDIRFAKKGEVRNDHKVKIGCFWSKRLNNSFYQMLVLEAQFESSDGESDIKDDRAKIKHQRRW